MVYNIPQILPNMGVLMRMFVNVRIFTSNEQLNFALTVYRKCIARQNSSNCAVNKSSIMWVGRSCNDYWNHH